MIFASFLIHICTQILLRSGLNAKAVSIGKLPAKVLGEVNYTNGDMLHSLKSSSWIEPCLWNSDCQNGGTCEDQDEFKLCKCKPGVLGGRCHVVGDCHDKYSSCEKERGTCSYDVEKEKAVCTCSSDKVLHPYENICKETCMSDVDCQNNGICKDKGGNGFCECKPEIKGDRCETVYDCTSGKYKNCKGENGTCSYNFDTNAAECRCYGDKMLHDQENICKETCMSDVDCQNNGICKDKGGNGFCECKPEIKGDRCETVYDCTSGKYKNCKGENGTCSYNFDTNAAECRCYGDKKLHDQENICKDIIYSASTTESTTKHLTTITSKGICNDDKCLQGQCQVHGQVYRCKCYEGYSGSRCESKIQTKPGYQMMWNILIFSFIVAMFLLLSTMFCISLRQRNKYFLSNVS